MEEESGDRDDNGQVAPVARSIWDAERADYLATAFTEVFKFWSSKAEENDLNDLLIPPQPVHFTPLGGSIRDTNKRLGDKMDDRISNVFFAIFIFGIFVYEAQAYYALFPHKNTALIWAVSLCVTLLCLVFSVTKFYTLAVWEN